MPWRSCATRSVPTADEVLARVAYHFSMRLAEDHLRAAVVERCKIGERTLRRYADYRLDEDGRLDVSSGPRKTEILIRIAEAMNDSAGLVLWAAAHSDNYATMLYLLNLKSRDPLVESTPPAPEIGIEERGSTSPPVGVSRRKVAALGLRAA